MLKSIHIGYHTGLRGFSSQAEERREMLQNPKLHKRIMSAIWDFRYISAIF